MANCLCVREDRYMGLMMMMAMMMMSMWGVCRRLKRQVELERR